MVRLHSTGLSFSSVLCPATRRRRGKVGLEAGAARYNVSNVDRECTQITINLGGSLQLPAEAALLCKDWLAIRAQAGVRSSKNRERESCRRHLYQMLSFEKDDTHTPSSLCCVVVLSGYHRPPLTVPPFKEPIGTPVVFQSQPTVVNIFIRSSSNHRHQYFVQKLTTLGSSAGAATLARVSICKRQLISTYVCVFNNSSELHMKPDTNNSARKLYIFRTISNPRRCHRTQHICPRGKKLDFLLTRTYYFLVTLFLFFPAFSC